MATIAENERLAVLESQYKTLQSDVSEIKSDVKALVANQMQLATALAVRDAATMEASNLKGSAGVWVRSFLPLVFAMAAVVISILNTLK